MTELKPMVIEPSNLELKADIIRSDIAELHKKVKDLKVENEEDLRLGSLYLSEIKSRADRLEILRKEAVQPLNEYVKRLNNSAKTQSGPLSEMEMSVKGKIKAYLDEVARKAREDAERLRREQEEKERIERQKLEEARRKEEEARRKELEARRAEEEAKTKKAREAAAKKAEEARKKAEEEAAKVAEAQKELENNELRVVEEPKKSIRTEGGLVTRKLIWTWKVVDEVILRKNRPELFVLDEKAVNQLIKDGARNIDGLEIYQESDVSLRR